MSIPLTWIRVFAVVILFGAWFTVAATIKTRSENISFDTNSDSTSEMSLSPTGLHIGSGTSSANLSVSGNAIITKTLSVGGTSSSANLYVQGSMGFAMQQISGNASLDNYSYHRVDSTSESILLTLPYAGNHIGQRHTIKKTSTNNRVVIRARSSNIVPHSPLVMPSNAQGSLPYTSLISNGSSWYELNSSSDVGELAGSNLLYHFKFDETSGSSIADSKNQISQAVTDGFIQSADGMVGSSHLFTGGGNAIYFSSGNFTRPSG
ncbi:MAG: hypothetical protein HQL32_13410, partial [Planctomycetes bacterium]|nr:hypothetical protein [Planctomycetota bacterium]